MNPSTTNLKRPETKEGIENQELGFLGLLRRTLKIHLRNTHVIIFTLFTSLPLLFFMIVFELLLEITFTESLKIIAPYSHYGRRWWPLLYRLQWNDPTSEFYQRLIFLPLIHLFPLHLAEFLTAFITVDLASKMIKDDQISIRGISINRERLKGSFVTSLYVLFLSTSFSLGFIWLVTGFFTFGDNYLWGLMFTSVFLAVAIMMFPKYLELNAVWNLSLVVSVLEEVRGSDALIVSFYFCKGNRGIGRDLMLVFLVWGFALRIPPLFFDDGEAGLIGRTSLLWLGNWMKWVVLVVYYYYCKSKVSGMGVDEGQVGGKASSINN